MTHLGYCLRRQDAPECAVVQEPPRSIGIVEDDAGYAAALEASLASGGFQTRVWRSAEAFWHDRAGHSVDLLLLDVMLPGMSGVELAGLVTLHFPAVRKVILTTVQTDEEIFQALRSGCLGYALKAELASVLAAVQIVLEGGALMSPTIALKVMRTFDCSENMANNLLTTREMQVLQQFVTGASTARTADILGITQHTVRNHLKHIYEKCSVSNRQALMRRARELGYY